MYRGCGGAAEELQLTGLLPSPDPGRDFFSSSPERNRSLKKRKSTGFTGDTVRCHPAAPCETCCP